MNDILTALREKLERAFTPSLLDVVDESHQHAGHAGFREGEITHVYVRIVAGAFTGKPLLTRHRAIYDVLREEMKSIHALRIDAKTSA